MNYALEILEIKKSEVEDCRQAYLFYQSGQINDKTYLAYSKNIKELDDAIQLLKHRIANTKPATDLKRRWDI